ncbi:MAG TPA: hypothetical protein PLV92_11690, partial [Pirellulaceae bacterium]|nr:hypothetical protein [Pirellulaceae bacterium]
GGSRGELKLKTKTLPLAALAPVLRRFAGHSRIEGTLTTDARYGWQAAAQFQHQIDFKQFAAEGLSLAASQWLGRDNLDVPLVEAHGSIQMQGDRVTVRDFALKSDVASVEADGSFKLSELTSTTGMLAALHDEDYSLRANVDLARLAKLAPATLRIRPGTELKAGRITADLESKATPDGHTWKSNIELGGLAAIIDGKPVEWQQPPLKLAVAAREGRGGLKIDQLTCDSSFLRAEARGGLADGTLELDANLGQLAAELDRFIDLGDNRMGGQLQADFGWKRADDGRLVANGKLHLQNMEWLVGDSRPWREPKLEVTLSAAGKSDNLKLRDLVQASVRVEAGKDVLTLELTEPIRDIATQTNWPLKGRLTGNLQRWLPRVQGFLPLAGWDLAGEVDVSGVATVSSDTIDIETASVNATDLQVAHEGLYINEPQIKSEFAAKLDRRTGRFQAPTATFASSTLAFRADDVKFESSDAGPQISANVGFRSDLARLGGWFQDPRANVDWQLTGLATGQVRLTHTGEQTTARWAVDVDNMSYSRAPDPRTQVTRTAATAPELELVWSEPKVRLSGQGIYESPRELVKLASCELEANSVKLAAAGTIEKPSSDCQVALQGEIAYDLQELSQRLRPQLGNMFDLRGRDTRPFALKGPVRNLEVQTGSAGNSRLVSGSTRAGSSGGLGGGFASTGPGGRGAGGSTVGGQGAAPSGAAWLRKELNANAGLAWVSANALGLPLGPGEIEAKLEQGVLQLKPVQVDVSEGHLRLAPRIHFDRPSPVMVADAGPVLEQVRISPEMCAMWLKYVLPILADVTEAEGKFSVQLSETATVPLDQPLDGEIRGQIDIHSVQVGPGPLAREMITLAQMIKALADNRPLPSESGQQPRMWVQLPQQPIPFHWKERRVYHDKLEINIQDVAIVTHGSVGADQTLDMVAMLPIRDEWVAKSRFLAALKGQQLQLPVTGTLSAPRVDRRVFQQLTRQAVTNTAGKLIEQEVGRGLDKLFKPKQPAGGGAQGQA